MQKSVDTSQSTSSNTDEASRVEVATATLINLESPVSASDTASAAGPSTLASSSGPSGLAVSSGPVPLGPEDQLDSIESSDQWHPARMQISSVSAV